MKENLLTRRAFLISASSTLCVPLLANIRDIKPYIKSFKIVQEPYQSIARVYDDIFPSSGDAPSARDINALEYLHGVMYDPRIEKYEKEFITNGATWLNETSQELYAKSYILLDATKRQKVLDEIVTYRWGENWLWTLQSYLLEALLSDPIYGSNEGKIGWKWLGHVSGYPRPKKVIL